MKFSILFSLFFILQMCVNQKEEVKGVHEKKIPFDSHVHIMSPGLIQYWKNIGIPFSKSEAFYSNVDTILNFNQADKIILIGMGYVYGNPEYYEGDDGHQKLQSENDYLIRESKKYPERIIPYFTINPLDERSLAEIERCYNLIKGGGLKLHFNASQVYLTVPEHKEKIKRIFSKIAEIDIPILLHFDNWHPKFGKPDLEILVDSILMSVPKINLQIAHFGTSGGFNIKTRHFLDSFMEIRDRIPARHHIYFDISAVALDKESEGVAKLTDSDFRELRKYIDRIGIDHIVFGTDYPLYTSPEYLKILQDKLDLTPEEIKLILKEKTMN